MAAALIEKSVELLEELRHNDAPLPSNLVAERKRLMEELFGTGSEASIKPGDAASLLALDREIVLELRSQLVRTQNSLSVAHKALNARSRYQAEENSNALFVDTTG